MITTLLLVAAMVSGAVDAEAALMNSRSIVYLTGDTTGFTNYASITEGTVYGTTFSTRFDQDYYQFVPGESGIFTFSAIDGLNVSVSVYGQVLTNTPVLITSYTVNSTESNFGYNHGVYLDLEKYDYFYYVATNASGLQNQSYFLSVNELEIHNSALDLFRYDVAQKTYSSLAFSSTGSGASSTSGYNPNGSASISLPSYPTGTDVNLTVANGFNTLTTYPYSAVAANCTDHRSTSFLIGSRIAATAMHCVSAEGHIKYDITSIHLLFGSNTKYVSTTYGVFTSLYFSPHWFLQDVAANQVDWALGVLDDDYGDTFGYLPIAKAESYNLTTSSQLVIDGYKSNLNYQVLSYANYQEYYGAKIRYTYVTAGGDSGAPVISFDHGKVMAIHTGSSVPNYSNGTYFDDYRFALAEQLIGGYMS